jgi:DNA-directed RNA polymerase specialized sigma24 family protein
MAMRLAGGSGAADGGTGSGRSPERHAQIMNPERIRTALAGDPEAVSELLNEATPIVQARVARALLRRPEARGRELRHELKDLVQEVLVGLFTADGKALRAWNPQRGLSFTNFVGLLAQRRVALLLRTRHGSPWNEADLARPPPDAAVGSSELLPVLLEHMEADLSARGMELFHRLYVAQKSIEEVCGQTGLRANVLQRWGQRLARAAQRSLRALQSERTRPKPSEDAVQLGGPADSLERTRNTP